MAVVEEAKFQRKKKGKSFLQKAKKFGKQGQRGRGSQIAQDQYDYLVRVMERWREPWESEEEKEIFVSNVMQQTEGEERALCGNQLASRVIELILPYASPSVSARIGAALMEDLRLACMDPFMSHVLEKLLILSTFAKAGQHTEIKEEEILTLETDDEEEGEKTGGEEKVVQPQLWEKCLLMTEQPDEYDSGDDPEYVPPPVILDTSFEYDEFVEEEEIISDNEVEMLKADAVKDLQTPTCYIPIWVAVDSPSERIQRAKEQFAGLASTDVIQAEDTSGKDTDSNGKKEVDAGLDAKSPKASKPQRERKKSKSKSGDEKSSDDGEKTEVKIPKTPTKAEGFGENMSPKKSPEKVIKSPKNSVGDETAETEKIPEN